MDNCPICSNHLNNVILSLSKSANSSFINGGSEEDNEPVNNIDDDSESDEDSDDDMECDNLGISANESHIENIINTINFSVMQLRPESPTNTSCLSINNNSECDAGTSTLLPNVEPPKKSPHCSACHHTRAVHGKGSVNAKCAMCPNNICSAAGRQKQCICQWHISQTNSTETVVPYSVVTFTIVDNHLNEYLLSFCQSNINNQLLGSNACTIIAVLAAINFLSETAWFSQHMQPTLHTGFEFSCILLPTVY